MKKNMETITKKKFFTNIEEVPVWVKSHELTLATYEITKTFPKEEMFGLTSQIRRSACSIPANITEGFYRNSTKELIQFLFNARGSLGESIYHIRLARDLHYISGDQFLELKTDFDDVGKQLNGWIKSLKERLKK